MNWRPCCLWLCLVSLVPLSSVAGTSCSELLNASSETIIGTSYEEFDQSPHSGFRKLSDAECFTDAAVLVDRYLASTNDLTRRQRQILRFHQGQVEAFGGAYTSAAAYMAQALAGEGDVRDGFEWNAYVEGTIAFLRGETAVLRAKAEKLAAADQDENETNLRVLTTLDRCQGKSYLEAYRGCKALD